MERLLLSMLQLWLMLAFAGESVGSTHGFQCSGVPAEAPQTQPALRGFVGGEDAVAQLPEQPRRGLAEKLDSESIMLQVRNQMDARLSARSLHYLRASGPLGQSHGLEDRRLHIKLNARILLLRTTLRAAISFAQDLSAESASIETGIQALRVGLLPTMAPILAQSTSPNSVDSSSILAAINAIENALEEVVATRAGFECYEDFERYVTMGAPEALVQGLGSLLGHISTVAVQFLPTDSGAEVLRCFGAVQLILEILACGFEAFWRRDVHGGAEALYLGLTDALQLVFQDESADEVDSLAAMKLLDIDIGEMTQSMLEHQRRALETNICVRTERARAKRLPVVCPPGYSGDGVGGCHSTAAVSNAGSITSVPASCESFGQFQERHGHFCYAACSENFQTRSLFACVSRCPATFSSELANHCFRHGRVDNASDFSTAFTNSTFDVNELMASLKEKGTVDASTLRLTFETLSTMAQKPPSFTSCASLIATFSSLLCDLTSGVYISNSVGKYIVNTSNGLELKDASRLVAWTLTDAGEGKVFITSAQGRRLVDDLVEVSATSDENSRWEIIDAGNGTVFIENDWRHRLSEHYGHVSFVRGVDFGDKWKLTDVNGVSICISKFAHSRFAGTTTTMRTTGAALTAQAHTTALPIGTQSIGSTSDRLPFLSSSASTASPQPLPTTSLVPLATPTPPSLLESTTTGVSAFVAPSLSPTLVETTMTPTLRPVLIQTLAPTMAPSVPPTPNCFDDSAGMVVTAIELGLGPISGCFDVRDECGSAGLGTTVRTFCPFTCDAC